MKVFSIKILSFIFIVKFSMYNMAEVEYLREIEEICIKRATRAIEYCKNSLILCELKNKPNESGDITDVTSIAKNIIEESNGKNKNKFLVTVTFKVRETDIEDNFFDILCKEVFIALKYLNKESASICVEMPPNDSFDTSVRRFDEGIERLNSFIKSKSNKNQTRHCYKYFFIISSDPAKTPNIAYFLFQAAVDFFKRNFKPENHEKINEKYFIADFHDEKNENDFRKMVSGYYTLPCYVNMEVYITEDNRYKFCRFIKNQEPLNDKDKEKFFNVREIQKSFTKDEEENTHLVYSDGIFRYAKNIYNDKNDIKTTLDFNCECIDSSGKFSTISISFSKSEEICCENTRIVKIEYSNEDKDDNSNKKNWCVSENFQKLSELNSQKQREDYYEFLRNLRGIYYTLTLKYTSRYCCDEILEFQKDRFFKINETVIESDSFTIYNIGVYIKDYLSNKLYADEVLEINKGYVINKKGENFISSVFGESEILNFQKDDGDKYSYYNSFINDRFHIHKTVYNAYFRLKNIDWTQEESNKNNFFNFFKYNLGLKIKTSYGRLFYMNVERKPVLYRRMNEIIRIKLISFFESRQIADLVNSNIRIFNENRMLDESEISFTSVLTNPINFIPYLYRRIKPHKDDNDTVTKSSEFILPVIHNGFLEKILDDVKNNEYNMNPTLSSKESFKIHLEKIMKEYLKEENDNGDITQNDKEVYELLMNENNFISELADKIFDDIGFQLMSANHSYNMKLFEIIDSKFLK